MANASTQFKKGQSGNPKGKPKGANKYNKLRAERMHASGHTDPLDFLLMIQDDPTVDLELRAKAAKDALPYIRKRKPQALEVVGKFEFLSPEERSMRRSLLLEEIRERTAATAAANQN